MVVLLRLGWVAIDSVTGAPGPQEQKTTMATLAKNRSFTAKSPSQKAGAEITYSIGGWVSLIKHW